LKSDIEIAQAAEMKDILNYTVTTRQKSVLMSLKILKTGLTANI
jgi:hypothetical protein